MKASAAEFPLKHPVGRSTSREPVVLGRFSITTTMTAHVDLGVLHGQDRPPAPVQDPQHHPPEPDHDHEPWVVGHDPGIHTKPSKKYEVNAVPYSKLKAKFLKHWRKIVVITAIPFAVFLLVILVALLRTLFISHEGIPVPSGLRLDKVKLIDRKHIDSRAERLSQALQIDTAPEEERNQTRDNELGLLEMHAFLEHSFPEIHSTSFIKREVVNKYSLLYTVQGTEPYKLPYLLAAHLDVVNADPSDWELPPFSGQIVNKTYVYGRGAFDNKLGVMATMEALEQILLVRERPRRSFYLAFGHDKEHGGYRGAKNIAEYLKSRNVTLDFVLDEGFPITRGVLKHTNRSVAMIGVAEKGDVDVELSVKGTSSHSSFPPRKTAIGILGEAVARLENNPQHAHLKGVEVDTFKYLIPYMNFSTRFTYTNLWAFSNGVIAELGMEPITNALIRTTSAVTSFTGGGGEPDVVPAKARAIVNHRVIPTKSTHDAVEYDKKVIADRRVRIRILNKRAASTVSPYKQSDAIEFQLVATSIKQVFPEAVIVPSVLITKTDTRWYSNLTLNIYRFLPTTANREDLNRYHGDNERISIENYHKAVNFYYRIIKNSDLKEEKHNKQDERTQGLDADTTEREISREITPSKNTRKELLELKEGKRNKQDNRTQGLDTETEEREISKVITPSKNTRKELSATKEGKRNKQDERTQGLNTETDEREISREIAPSKNKTSKHSTVSVVNKPT